MIPSHVLAGEIENYFDQDSQSLRPLTSRNQTPLLNLFYVMPVTSAQTMEKGKFEFRLDFDLSQILEVNNNPIYGVNYDQEIYRTSFQFTYGLWKNMEIHLEIPTLSTDDGFLDGFINGYHDALGLPDGGRNNFFANQHGYVLSQNGIPFVNYTPLEFDLGDINLDFKWVVLQEKGWIPSLALRTGVKFPTGNFEKASGSGGLGCSHGLCCFKIYQTISFLYGIRFYFNRRPCTD